MKPPRPTPRLAPSGDVAAIRNDRSSSLGITDECRRVLPHRPKQFARRRSTAGNEGVDAQHLWCIP